MLLSFVLALSLCSCSIKEDRSPCPCWLQVFFDRFPDSGVVLTGYTTENIFGESVGKDDFEDFVELTVPRTLLSVSSYRRTPGITHSGRKITISRGCQADSLYAHQAYVDCSGENAVDTVSFHKQFATVYLTFENSEGETLAKYDVLVKGGVNGMDLATLEPIEGEFEFKPEEREDNFFVFRIPRQNDDSLSLELYDKSDGEFVDAIGAGLLIRNSGFDWRAKDLKDIVINVDFAKMNLEVSVREWDAQEIYDITI